MSACKSTWSVKFYGERRGVSGSTVVGPGSLLRALAYLMFVPSQDGFIRRRLVDFDDEMRSWGRYDWVQNPTAEDREHAAEVKRRLIPVRPGESILLSFRSGSSSACVPSANGEGGAK